MPASSAASSPGGLPWTRIVSGGQTGADRAALDWAIAYGCPHGGWCPKGRKAEDGPLDARYLLAETAGADYIERTRLNVRDSDATLIANLGVLDGGSLRTLEFAQALGKPVLVVQLDAGVTAAAVEAVRAWLRPRPATLNVAGPRESKRPGMYRLVHELLEAVARAEGV